MQLAPALAPIRTPDTYTETGAYRVLARAASKLDDACQAISTAHSNPDRSAPLARNERTLLLVSEARTHAEEAVALLRNLRAHKPAGSNADFEFGSSLRTVTDGLDKLSTVLRRFPDLNRTQITDAAFGASMLFSNVSEDLWETLANR